VTDNKAMNDFFKELGAFADQKSVLGDKNTLKELMDMIEKQKRETSVIGTLKIRDNKLIIEHDLREIVMCDLEDKNAASMIMAVIAKIQLEETLNAGK